MTAAPTPPALHLENFRLGYRAGGHLRVIVEDVTLEVPRGELLLFVGPSGSGKSSVMAALLGFDDPYSPRIETGGHLALLGETVPGPLPSRLRRRIGVLFQDGALIDDLSPTENVALAVREAGTGVAAGDLLARTGLPHPPAEVAMLSGGQKRRVSLARALATEPELLILDEPTAGLDEPSAHSTAALIREVHESGSPGRTTIVITHDLEAFLPHADGALILDPASRSLRRVPPEEIENAVTAARDAAAESAPTIRPAGALERTGRTVARTLLNLGGMAHLAATSVRHVVPYHFGMLGRSLLDQVLTPALFLAVAALTTGALATTFAIGNNPLEGGFRREVLMGNGKVLVSTALPLIVGVLFAARTAAAAAARIGSLRRAQVFEALPLIGVSPHAFLLTPLLWSSVLGVLVLTAVGLVIGCLASLVVTVLTTSFSSFGWASASFSLVSGSDLRCVILKATGGGALTALLAYYLASRPKSSARDVAAATSSALVAATLATLIWHGAWTMVWFG